MLASHGRGFVLMARLDLDTTNECVHQASFDCPPDTLASSGRVNRPAVVQQGCDDFPVTLVDLSRLAAKLDGVSESRREGLLDWRYRGRLVARQLDDSHVVIRVSFEFRDLLLRSFPETFSVPKRFAKHMMVVADLANANADAVEDAVIGAWELQSGR